MIFLTELILQQQGEKKVILAAYLKQEHTHTYTHIYIPCTKKDKSIYTYEIITIDICLGKQFMQVI